MTNTLSKTTNGYDGRIFLMGAGGFGREVAWVLEEQKAFPDRLPYRFGGFVDDTEKRWGESIAGNKIWGDLKHLAGWSRGENCWPSILPAVGSPQLKRSFTARLEELGYALPLFIAHESAEIGPDCEFGDGTIICANASITCNVKLGRQVNVNLNCTIGHDVVIGNYVNLSPAVNISGYAVIEDEVDIGTGAIILPKVRVGKRAVIGAGAVVTKDVPPGELWVGCPAKYVRTVV